MSRSMFAKFAAIAGVLALGIAAGPSFAVAPQATPAAGQGPGSGAEPGAPDTVQRKGGGWDLNGPLLSGTTGPALDALTIAH